MGLHGVTEGERVRWRLRADLAPAALAERLERALAAARLAPDLKSGRRKSLYALDLAGLGATDHLLKVSRYPRGRGLSIRPGRSKARRELAVAERLAGAGLPVGVPLAAGELRRRGGLVACFLLTAYRPGWVDLEELWRGGLAEAGECRALAAALGGLVRRVHAAGLDHGDLLPNNVLVQRGSPPRLQLIDFERAHLRRRMSPRRRARALAALERALPGASRSLRLHFLRAYAAGDRAAARRWWRAVERAAPRLAAGDHARMRRAASRPGRRFRRIDAGELCGIARRDSPAPALSAAVRAASALRAEPPDGLWLVRYPGASARRARELWARANSLYVRGLAPRPLALLRGADGPLLVLERGAWRSGGGREGGASAGERVAAARLLAGLLALGRLEAGLCAESLALPAASGPALLIRPETFRFSRRGSDSRSRAIAHRVLAEL